MFTLSALAYNCIKSITPDSFLSACSRLKKKWLSIERDKLQVEFLNACLDAEVVPKHLLEMVPKRQRNNSKFGEAQKNVLIEAIAKRIDESVMHESEYANEMARVALADQRTANIIIAHHTKRDTHTIKQKNISQLKSLSMTRNAKLLQKELQVRPVINLSNYTLSKSQYETLSYGFNMTWPRKIDNNSIKVTLENLYSQIENLSSIPSQSLEEIKNKLKHHYGNMERCKNKRIPLKILNHIKNLLSLQNEKSIYVSRFDKGNGVCIDVKERYIYKMQQLLSDKTKFSEFKQDKRVKGDTFIYAEERFNRVIKELCKTHKIPKDIENKMISTGSTPARLYGLPKVHKNEKNPPYRPVLSMINSYPAKLSQYLDNILKPFIPTDRTCRDSFEFKEKLVSKSFPSTCHCVSYDVKSLFTNIPVKETINYIMEILPNNDLPLNKTALKKLLNLACSNILFSFQNKCYTQDDGMCMGSSLGPTMAAFALDMIERNFDNTPLFYSRYVDDIFAVFNSKEESISFLDHINSFHPNLQFTLEHSIDNCLNFLDISVDFKDNKFSTSWFMKNTNTGIYLPKSGYSPLNYKTAAIKSLVSRAFKLSSTLDRFLVSYKKIQLIFVNNGYHYKFIDKIKERVIKPRNLSTQNENDTTKYIYYKLPYIKHTEKQNKATFQEINTLLQGKAHIRLAYSTNKTSAYFPNKDALTDGLKSNLVYQFTCKRCGACYTGETVRHLSTRISEHIEGRPTPSEVATHEHRVTKEQFSIALRTRHTKKKCGPR